MAHVLRTAGMVLRALFFASCAALFLWVAFSQYWWEIVSFFK